MSEMKSEKGQGKLKCPEQGTSDGHMVRKMNGQQEGQRVNPIRIKVIYGEGNLIDCMKSVISLQGMG